MNVKSTTSTMTKWSDNEYEEEDHFFHALYHNNDAKVVKNVSTKTDVDSEDELMFKRMHDKFFHRRGGSEEGNEGNNRDTANVVREKYHFQDVIEECSFFE